MWRVLVSKADTVAGQVTLGFVNTCVNYPTLAFGFLAIMLMLVCALWVEVLNVRLSVMRSSVKVDRPRSSRSDPRSLAPIHFRSFGQGNQETLSTCRLGAECRCGRKTSQKAVRPSILEPE